MISSFDFDSAPILRTLLQGTILSAQIGMIGFILAYIDISIDSNCVTRVPGVLLLAVIIIPLALFDGRLSHRYPIVLQSVNL
ncbi:uncharacterized protein P174DRAFT_444196 [Aspergillus novofumigatus IBT 16806]|uniref:Uncharacterized protein n=1 Tax=Aspergillus novofumigatus (strain IBT 16806) TaxID=1392255 RepID=A0A2I1C3I2_ASPN1|nr:uncharacterized protein P174DRAFT_444196 [Aspergillus novofumigatus IBT 16806]PKX92158.1 hypothetical protein P174DRAFT_444196 [Aspergillus novofumigatus IBT 16806]